MGWRQRWGWDGDRLGVGGHIKNREGDEDKDKGGNRDGDEGRWGWMGTHAFELDVAEDAGQQEPPQRHREDKDEGQRQRCRAGFHPPEQRQHQDLSQGKDVHPPRLHLRHREGSGGLRAW